MTSIKGKAYMWLPMPNIVSVKCPHCSCHSEFSFSKSIIPKKIDRAYFEKSRSFKTEKVLSDTGWKYLAWYDPGLGKRNIDVIHDLPVGVKAEDFKPNNFYVRHNLSRGVVVCHSCSLRKLHTLTWPDDAFFEVDYKGETLWAFNREMALTILNYLQSSDRKKRIVSTTGHVSQHSWLRKIPTVFQTKKARREVVTKLRKVLA